MYFLAVTAWDTVWAIALVAIGLGAVIFVHELGHFVVAKLCGVKCEKFYIGFDVPLKFGKFRLPSSIWKKKLGETVYGIGILPLGGYVKMLGQDDNPANITDEMRRAQEAAEDSDETKEIVGPSGEKYRVHARSYLAKTVPQRMAIISAGVIMNVIFAFVFAVIAFRVGVPYMPCIVSETIPGSPAWEAGLAVGDEIVQLDEKRSPSFNDLRGGVTLGDLESGVPLQIESPHGAEDDAGTIRDIRLKPRQGKNGTGLASIGIISPRSLRLVDDDPVDPFSPAGRATFSSGDLGEATSTADQENEKKPAGGDEIIAVNGIAVSNWRDYSAILSAHRDETLQITVRREGVVDKDNPFAPKTGGRELTFAVEPAPIVRLGLVMKIGRVVAVQDGSPAKSAGGEGNGIRPGDFLHSMNGQPIGDPFTWPERVRTLGKQGEWIALELRRTGSTGEDEPVKFENIKARVPDWIETVSGVNTPMSCPALGIAYRLLNVVDRVLPGSPAEAAGIRSGDTIVLGEIIVGKDDKRKIEIRPIAFSEDERNWPMFMQLLQSLSPGTKIKLQVERRDEKLDVTMKPAVVEASTAEGRIYNPVRGFRLAPLRRIRIANALGEQLRMGWEKTADSLMLVYRFLGKIGGQVPLTALGGPITIAKASYYSAFEGFGKLLVFLTMLSANLAVINFLPIPLLDGGHMLFLAYEGVSRRPPSERFVVAMHMIGFAFIIGLMVFVFSLDLGIIPRNL